MTDELKKIGETLGIQFEEYEYKKEQANSYEYYRGTVRKLTITGCVFGLDVLLPLTNELCRLNLKNCTIDSLAGLGQLPHLIEIHFDNVTIKRGEKAMRPLFDTIPIRDRPLHVYLKNMHLEYPAELLALTGKLDHLFLTNCTISNFYEINLFPNLYDLRLTNVRIQQSEDDIVHEALPGRRFIRICLDEMNLESLDVFIPISENVSNIQLEHCVIKSIRNIPQFTQLDKLEIDSETQIHDTAFAIEQAADFYIENCVVGRVGRYEFVPEETFPFDLQQLGSIAHYLVHINFQGSLTNNTDCLKHFRQLETLEFDKGTVYLGDFLSVAHQIKTLVFEECKVEQYDCIAEFTQLETIQTKSFHEHKMLGDLKVLLPLKHQLKELDLFEEDIQNLGLISEFTALEKVDLRSLNSVEVAQNVLTLGSLKKLCWSLDLETEPEQPLIVDVSALKSMRNLELSGDHMTITGIESLTELERLELHCSCPVDRLHQLKKLEFLDLVTGEGFDVNRISTMESLKILILSVDEGQEVYMLEQFPNLEQLKLESGDKVHIGKLEKLKVLIPGQIDLETTTLFDQLPNLEKLNLQYKSISVIKNLNKLTNLKWLDLSENEIESLDGLENLKNLEYLNLYENKISDVRILNQLPNLKQVNLAANEIEEEEAREQLTKPEIARFLYRPYIPFSIGIED
ncbi:MAG TPA: leucine-rich repeat domain-containing protein [Bacteroidia bacterium]|nr:leucine-rich repeat domain-containing protein [Bacteroidia bacterium]